MAGYVGQDSPSEATHMCPCTLYMRHLSESPAVRCAHYYPEAPRSPAVPSPSSQPTCSEEGDAHWAQEPHESPWRFSCVTMLPLQGSPRGVQQFIPHRPLYSSLRVAPQLHPARLPLPHYWSGWPGSSFLWAVVLA